MYKELSMERGQAESDDVRKRTSLQTSIPGGKHYRTFTSLDWQKGAHLIVTDTPRQPAQRIWSTSARGIAITELARVSLQKSTVINTERTYRIVKAAVMNSAKLYSSASEMQHRDAAEAISRHVGAMTWLDDGAETVLDVGCGSGEVTRRLLLPVLPATGRIVAVDASEAMIRFASVRHRHPRLSFRTMDILDPHLKETFPHGFRKVFSFFCLHWVREQRIAMKNIHDLLMPEGEALLVFLASSPIFDVYEHMASSPKWSKYTKDYENYISPYHHSKTPTQDLKNVMIDVGFQVLNCETRDRVFVFNEFQQLKDAVKAVNPFLDRVPRDMHEEYLSDFLLESKKLKTKVQVNNGKLSAKYQLFEVLVKRVK
ncbi:juvenile hormone acid O-methyltransferase [Ischnura elegans]|uniref:juvenile hormone acid O-methyltransferase n=1 Tax=Ischnura elegans TaxID=197161 RepID=UPI001ED88EBE|nr:juvenile hormone acid O-methyltransferase [Ischnura elegans]